VTSDAGSIRSECAERPIMARRPAHTRIDQTIVDNTMIDRTMIDADGANYMLSA
jgi:hypothetical protein